MLHSRNLSTNLTCFFYFKLNIEDDDNLCFRDTILYPCNKFNAYALTFESWCAAPLLFCPFPSSPTYPPSYLPSLSRAVPLFPPLPPATAIGLLDLNGNGFYQYTKF